MGRGEGTRPILFCFLILRCHLIPSFLWPFVSASFHSNSNQQAACLPLSSLFTENSRQGQTQLWVEEESRRFISFSSMLTCGFVVKVRICFWVSTSLSIFWLQVIYIYVYIIFRACLSFHLGGWSSEFHF